MKRNRYIGYAMMAAGMLAATSCTDFDDYNEVQTGQESSAGQTLWENICQESSLTEFRALVERTGFNEQLSQARAYTVWAPKNGTFTLKDEIVQSDSMLLERFVKNHIAEYTYRVSGDIGQSRVRMLNGKSYSLVGNGDYTFNDVQMVPGYINLPGSNGMLHELDGDVEFYPNLYEKLVPGFGSDSIVNYIKRFEETTLDLTESEKGPMVDGMQTYVDSVMITKNSLLSQTLRASIANEDSSYTFIIPTDEAYMEMYNRVKKAYNFVSGTKVMDPSTLETAGNPNTADDRERNSKNAKTHETIAAAYMADSLARRAVISNLLYSNNDTYNQFLQERKGQEDDSLRSTTRTLLSNPNEIVFDHLVGEPERMSNGYMYQVDSLAFLSWETYCPELRFTIDRNLVKDFTSKITRYQMTEELSERLFGPENTTLNFTVIENSASRTQPKFYVSLPNVQSTTYNIYCVVLPAIISDDKNTTPMNFDLSYANDKGELANYHFSREFLETGKNENPTSQDLKTAYMNDPTKVDTMFIGQFTFPVNYRGLNSGYYPSLFITSPVAYSQRNQYSREFRIWAIILRPVEKEEYEANKQ